MDYSFNQLDDLRKTSNRGCGRGGRRDRGGRGKRKNGG